ncbi:MAG: ribonuclease Y [Candidatus Wildermuthbacteria bacterium RIFCSPLOWO2_01_FULL_48_29]|uniref:Ribonuclease Y n=2 Tax=Candidatus Wildermuthiibacteriota TaxID=1817923 RepID=A0A1G2RMD0_9BACT|nr:MAG: ribonuclease Y [Candidatus Wildermuthbacteria bacterium RIFCSPHIGHO2_01_FULL_48_27b]OHA73648.1 MAG: ribonuclease Y [Candidatus Wildermuthbacteria bacterium RIFCSPLOWO2_01_FULL_48_29]
MTEQLTLLVAGVLSLAAGSLLGYLARQSIARRQIGTLEQKVQQKIKEAGEESEKIISEAKTQAKEVTSTAKSEEERRRQSFLKTEQVLLQREETLTKRIVGFDAKEEEFRTKVEKLQASEKNLEQAKEEVSKKLEEAAQLSREEAKKELFNRVEKECEQDLVGRVRKLEAEGRDRFDRRAKEIVAYAIQKTAVSQTQEITTTTVILPSEDLKGKIIGKEGRNIRSLERLAGVEIVVDETPETVIISGFDPLRRHIAKVALERLIKDGRIHPARVEEEVAKVQAEVEEQMREAGEAASFDLGIVGLDPKLVQLLGRVKFRTSYGQNVLLHSVEVAYLASALAAEIGADVNVAKKAGLFHDIGKALDHQVEGSHVEIGMRVLEKFGVEKEVITAMKSHHEDYPYESIEAVLVQTADAISASRPGARKDTLENYLKRIGELESLATAFEGVEKAYAIQAGREIRVFVRPEKIDDVTAQKLARDIARRIEGELHYPGEIKVTLVRENRFIEYAR